MVVYRCPNCKSKNVIPIVYGYPSMDTVEMAERYEIKLGGCVVYADREMPDLYCKDCKKEWSVDDLTDRDITKIRFVIETCGPEPLEDHIKWVYEVFPNGACRYYEYKGYSRSSKEKKHFDIPSSEAMKLIHLLREYTYKRNIQNPEDFRVFDGSDYRLSITFSDRRKLCYEGSFGGGQIDSAMKEFIGNYFD